MKKSHLIFATLIFLIFAISVFAQEEETATNGQEEKWRNFEVSGFAGAALPSGGIKDWSDSIGAKTGLTFGANGGYYLTEKICLGAYFQYSQLGMEIYSRNHRLYDAGAYIKYAFVGESNFEPYVKLSAGVLWTKFATWVGPAYTRLRELSYNPGFKGALSAGLIYYTSDYGGVYAEMGYNYGAVKDKEEDYHSQKFNFSETVNYIDAKFGIVVFFGPEE